MTLSSQPSPDQRKVYNDLIDHRWGQLYELDKDWGEKALRLLLVVNAGGAIATLSFIGANQGKIDMFLARLTLLSFIAGIVSMMIVTAITYHHLHNLFEKYKVGAKKYFQGRISWTELDDQDEARAVEPTATYVFSYLAFALFVGGCILGGCALFT